MGEIRYLAESFGGPQHRDCPQMLRRIAERVESGEINADKFILIWEEDIEENSGRPLSSVSHNCTGILPVTYALGLLERAKIALHYNSIRRIS